MDSTEPRCFVVQIGNLTQDVQFWAPPENMTEEAYPRPVFTVSTANGAFMSSCSVCRLGPGLQRILGDSDYKRGMLAEYDVALGSAGLL